MCNNIALKYLEQILHEYVLTGSPIIQALKLSSFFMLNISKDLKSYFTHFLGQTVFFFLCILMVYFGCSVLYCIICIVLMVTFRQDIPVRYCRL